MITRPRADETLYSAMARASRYLGTPRPRLLHEALFGADLALFDDLPAGLDRVMASGVFGPCDDGGAGREWTLIQYYAHYTEPALARVAARAMAGEGRRPHAVLGSRWSAAPPPGRLRFCSACCAAMLGRHDDLWWRRVHQLPSVMVCPDHAVPLRFSTVEPADRRKRYVAAIPGTCPPDGAQVVEGREPWVMATLLDLARQSESVLNDCGETHPDDRREAYLQGLDGLGLLNRIGEANLPGIAKAMDGRWGESLDLWPRLRRDGRCEQGWLATLLTGEHVSPPLHHLLLEGLLSARYGRR
ncbi:TniQ family protein [Sphingomonas sp. Leaf33]|uniref:TniQ family protein n=1 Tax=Sphingomonas sp. Leaf33 TaxID=1736215 RepID=UPI0012E1945F|nr:TniQ family protein [Sphingomonas sp. Leaf33]